MPQMSMFAPSIIIGPSTRIVALNKTPLQTLTKLIILKMLFWIEMNREILCVKDGISRWVIVVNKTTYGKTYERFSMHRIKYFFVEGRGHKNYKAPFTMVHLGANNFTPIQQANGGPSVRSNRLFQLI